MEDEYIANLKSNPVRMSLNQSKNSGDNDLVFTVYDEKSTITVNNRGGFVLW